MIWKKNSLTISHNLLSSKLNMSTKFGAYESEIFSNTLSLSMTKRESIYFFMCEIFDNALFFGSSVKCIDRKKIYIMIKIKLASSIFVVTKLNDK